MFPKIAGCIRLSRHLMLCPVCLYATSRRIFGCLAAMRRSVLAAPDGDLRPCSQSRRVRGDMPNKAANLSCDKPVFERASATSERSAGIISSFSIVPSFRVTRRRNEPSGCGMNCVLRAHSTRLPLSMDLRKRPTASLALLIFEYLLDLFQPCAGHIIPFSLSISSDQNDSALCNPEKINYAGAAALPFAFCCPTQLAASASSRNNIACFGMITQKSLKGKKLAVGKQSALNSSKGGSSMNSKSIPKYTALP